MKIKFFLLALLSLFILNFMAIVEVSALTIDCNASAYLLANNTTEKDHAPYPTQNPAEAIAENSYTQDPPDTVNITTTAKAYGDTNGLIKGYAGYSQSRTGEGYNISPDGRASAVVKWSNTYTAYADGSYAWDFTILGGVLELYSFYGEVSVLAGYEFEILANGSQVWYSKGELQGYYDSGWQYNYVQEGVDLPFTSEEGGNPFSLSIIQTYDTYDGEAELGYFSEGESINITYIMNFWAEDPIVAGSSYAICNFYDPGGLNGPGGLTGGTLRGPGGAPVPEPCTMALVGTGLLGIGFLRRKINKRENKT